MFSISSIKKHAKASLHANYGKSIGWPVLLSVMTSMIMTAITIPLFALFFSDATLTQQIAMFNSGQLTSSELFALQQNIISIFSSFISGSNILYSLCNLLIIGNATVGTCYFFLRVYEDNDAAGSDIFSGFKRYFHVFTGVLLRNIFTALWSMLLIIPGIIKYYSYYFTPYILIEMPELSPFEAIKLSMDLTRGNKMKIFISQLSFIGWAILGILTFGLAFIFYVSPYYQITMAGIYSACRGSVSAGSKTYDSESAVKEIPFSLKDLNRTSTPSFNNIPSMPPPSITPDYYATGFMPLNAKKPATNVDSVKEQPKDINDEFNDFLNNINYIKK